MFCYFKLKSMSKLLRYSLKQLLSPCLFNIVGIKKFQSCENEPECKSLLYHNDGSSLELTELSDGDDGDDDYNVRHPYRYLERYVEDCKYKLSLSESDETKTFFCMPKVQNNDENTLLHEKLAGLIHFEIMGKMTDYFVFKGIDNYSLEDYRNMKVPYVSVAVSINGRLLLKTAFDYQDRENLVPAKEDMVGEIGSITKTLTALMIMKLIEEEEEALSESEPPVKRRRILENRRVPRITLDSYVEDILTPDIWPEHFVKGETDEQKHKNTIKQLLQHSSGIVDINKSYKLKKLCFTGSNELLNTNNGKLVNSVNLIKCKDLDLEPGVHFNYSNYAYQLLGLVYEKRTGRSFVEDLRDELAKMGLYDTDFNYREYLALDRARGCQYHWQISDINKSAYEDITWFEAAYGLVSTTSDLVKYGNIVANCLLNERDHATFPLKKSNMEIMMTTEPPTLQRTNAQQYDLNSISRRRLGWEYNFRYEDRNNNKYNENMYLHGGATLKNLSMVSLYINGNDPYSNGPPSSVETLQENPLVYPLGEQSIEGGDLVVGSLITDRSLDVNVEDLLVQVMNLVLCAYKGFYKN